MRLAPIILRLRAANTTFGNRIAGAAELELARTAEIRNDIAFVIPIDEKVLPSKNDGSIDQTINEKFAVIVCLANDSSQKDQLGLISYERLHDIRSEIFQAIVGWQIKNSPGMITYAGGQLLPLNPAYLWYQYDFETPARLIDHRDEGYADIDDPFTGSSGSDLRERIQTSQLADLVTIYTDYLLSPSEDLPYAGDLPIESASFPGIMTTIVNTGDDRTPGAFDRGFGSGYDFWRILNRRNDPK